MGKTVSAEDECGEDERERTNLPPLVRSRGGKKKKMITLELCTFRKSLFFFFLLSSNHSFLPFFLSFDSFIFVLSFFS